MQKIIHVIALLLVSSSVFASEALDKCLDSAVYHEHRIEKEENVKYCFDKFKTSVSKAECYKAIEDHPRLISTYRLKLYAQNICFYDVNSHANLNSCIDEAERFIGASEHDEALFYCYQIFQDRTSKKDCLSVAKKMKFFAKRTYLENHCRKN